MYHKVNNTIGNKNNQGMTVSFQGQDSEALYKESLKTQPADWIYKTAEVTYSYNELGHRAIPSSMLGEKNYVLSTGCSFTEGIGIATKHRYSDLVAKQLRLRSYNLGLGGSGLDLIALNLSLWLKHYPRPAAVIVQWPQKERKFYYPEPLKEEVHCVGSWILDPTIAKSYNSDESHRFKALLTTEAFDHYYTIMQQLVTSMLRVAKIPYVEMYIDGYTENEIASLDTPYTVYPPLQGDLARDLAHPGIFWNKVAATRALDKLLPQLTI